MRGGSGPTAYARINATEARVQHVFELAHREIVHPDLPNLGDDDESFARHVQRVRLLDISRQYQNKAVARIDPVIRVNRSRKIWIELGRGVSEEVQTKNHEAAVHIGLSPSGAAGQ